MNIKLFDTISVLAREATLKTFIEYKRLCSEKVSKYTKKIEELEIGRVD